MKFKRFKSLDKTDSVPFQIEVCSSQGNRTQFLLNRNILSKTLSILSTELLRFHQLICSFQQRTYYEPVNWWQLFTFYVSTNKSSAVNYDKKSMKKIQPSPPSLTSRQQILYCFCKVPIKYSNIEMLNKTKHKRSVNPSAWKMHYL